MCSRCAHVPCQVQCPLQQIMHSGVERQGSHLAGKVGSLSTVYCPPGGALRSQSQTARGYPLGHQGLPKEHLYTFILCAAS